MALQAKPDVQGAGLQSGAVLEGLQGVREELGGLARTISQLQEVGARGVARILDPSFFRSCGLPGGASAKMCDRVPMREGLLGVRGERGALAHTILQL